jgi:EAL domain-containing protein (putative c-di-GMP-specific phosphodiesterase class I)
MVRPELIKLDRAFVSNIDVDEAKTALVQMMGTLADRIGAKLVAEGVERVPELDRLRELGVPLAQGYLFARPAAEFGGISPEWAEALGARPAQPAHPASSPPPQPPG